MTCRRIVCIVPDSQAMREVLSMSIGDPIAMYGVGESAALQQMVNGCERKLWVSAYRRSLMVGAAERFGIPVEESTARVNGEDSPSPPVHVRFNDWVVVLSDHSAAVYRMPLTDERSRFVVALVGNRTGKWLFDPEQWGANDASILVEQAEDERAQPAVAV